MEEKEVPNDSTLVQKSAYAETYNGKIGTLTENENVDQTLRFNIYLNTWAPIYDLCWVILGSCCRPMHALTPTFQVIETIEKRVNVITVKLYDS